MGIDRLWTVSILGAAFLGATETVAQEQRAVPGEVLEARIWLDRGVDPVLRRGDWARVYYRASRDAYVSVFHIDTNGFTRLLHPGSPIDDHHALAGRDYRVLFPDSRYWHVDEDEGKGYLFIVASPTPLDFSRFAYGRYEGGWDISAVSQVGYRDPFLMMDDIVEALIPGSWAMNTPWISSRTILIARMTIRAFCATTVTGSSRCSTGIRTATGAPTSGS